MEQQQKMECCGSPRLTKFCPECGKHLSGKHTLATLLMHLERTAGAKRRLSDEKTAWGGQKEIDGNRRALAKWQAWAEQLREVIERQQSLTPPEDKEITGPAGGKPRKLTKAEQAICNSIAVAMIRLVIAKARVDRETFDESSRVLLSHGIRVTFERDIL